MNVDLHEPYRHLSLRFATSNTLMLGVRSKVHWSYTEAQSVILRIHVEARNIIGVRPSMMRADTDTATLPRQPGRASSGFFLRDDQIADELLMKHSAETTP